MYASRNTRKMLRKGGWNRTEVNPWNQCDQSVCKFHVIDVRCLAMREKDWSVGRQTGGGRKNQNCCPLPFIADDDEEEKEEGRGRRNLWGDCEHVLQCTPWRGIQCFPERGVQEGWSRATGGHGLADLCTPRPWGHWQSSPCRCPSDVGVTRRGDNFLLCACVHARVCSHMRLWVCVCARVCSFFILHSNRMPPTLDKQSVSFTFQDVKDNGQLFLSAIIVILISTAVFLPQPSFHPQNLLFY